MVSEKISASFGTNLWNCKIIRVNNLKYFRSAVARSVHLIVFLWEIEYFLEISSLKNLDFSMNNGRTSPAQLF